MTLSGACDTPDLGRPLTLDSHLTLPDRVLAAPLEGIMNPAFCAAANTLNLIRVWFTPFLSVTAQSVPSVRALRKELAYFAPETHTVIVQLLSDDPEAAGAAGLNLAQLGIAGVNLNFSCPSPCVTRGGRGAALLQSPDKIYAVCAAVQLCCSAKIQVSVKLRTGWKSPAELPAIAEAVRAAGIRFAVVHYRTAEEMYQPVDSGIALKRIARFRDLAGDGVAVFGNGDIRSRADALKMCMETGCDGVAVGRGLIGDPYLLRRIVTGKSDFGAANGLWRFLWELGAAAGQHYRRSPFLECARMALGAGTPEFRALTRMSDAEVTSFLRQKLESSGGTAD